jgi:serine/threonine-protein phosphatase 2A activator
MADDDQPHASSSFAIPTKHILSPAHLAAFQRSPTHRVIVEFIEQLNASIIDVRLTDVGAGSEVRPSATVRCQFIKLNTECHSALGL